MPTLYGNVYFNSGNVNSLVTNLDNSSLIPNRSYTITLNGIDHMKGYGIKSNLSDSYSDNITGYTTPITFSTPADNVESVIDLVRKTDTTISVYVHSLSSPNYSLEYTGYLRRYTNSGLTDDTTHIATYTNTNLPNIVHDIPNLLTRPYYFASDFTHDKYGVVKESNGTTVQKNQIFDIRGLAYMGRNFDKYDEDYRLNSYTPTLQREVRLSADGNRMITLYFDTTNGGNHLNIGKFSKNSTTTWSRFGEDYRIYFVGQGRLLDNNVQLHRYTTYPVHTTDNMWYTVMSTDLAFTEFGDRFIFLQGNHIKIHSFENNSLIKSIDFGRNVHCISVSADGKRLLASATHATSHNNTTLIGTDKGGTAKVYDLDTDTDTYAIVADLSSMHIPTLNSEIYYGSDATLSGDGKTAVIWGTENNSTTSHGFVWKFNDLTNIWIHIFTIEPSWSEYTRHRTPCAMSHDGNKTVVCCSIADSAFIYETSNNWLGAEMTKIVNNNINTCDISGDGETVLFAVSDGGQDNNIKVYRRNSDTWVLWRIKPFEGLHDSLFSRVQSCALSYDASTICLQQTNGRLYTLRYNKENVNVSAVYDYFNKKSHFEFLDYNLGEPDWDTTLYETNTNKSVAHYGIVDALSMSLIGQRVIVGSPEENKAYLYDNNSLVQTYIGSNRFGIRCSMNDYGNIIVIANNSHLNIYVYDGTTAPDSPIRTIAFGGTTDDSPWNMKISKYGSTIIASDFVSSVSFKSWTTADNWVSEPTSKTHTRDDDTSTAISAIDLSYDGSVMVASGFLGPSKGYVHLFKNLGEVSVAYAEINGHNTHYVGQSIALSGLGTKAIVGSPISTLTHSNSAVVHFIDITGNTMSWIPKTYSTAHTVRYGRSVSMDYHGYYAMVSGSGSEFNNYTTGSAIVIDMSGYTKVKELPKIDLSQKGASSVRHDWNGYGIHCKLSSRGDVAAVSGGGYAYLFKADLFLSTLRFPFSTDKESTDGSVKFTGVGTIIDDSLNLVSAQNEVLDLGSNAFQFGTDKGFVVEFDAKITDTSVEAVVLNINSDLFNVEISNYSSSLWQKIHVHSTDTNRAISFTSYAVYSGSWNVFKHFKYMYSHVTKNARTYLNGVETGNVSAATEIQYLPTPTNVNMISYTNKFHIKNLTFRVID